MLIDHPIVIVEHTVFLVQRYLVNSANDGTECVEYVIAISCFLCRIQIVVVQSQFYTKQIICGGATVVNGIWRRKGIERMISAAVGGKRRVIRRRG